jgi:hypothetical protein
VGVAGQRFAASVALFTCFNAGKELVRFNLKGGRPPLFPTAREESGHHHRDLWIANEDDWGMAVRRWPNQPSTYLRLGSGLDLTYAARVPGVDMMMGRLGGCMAARGAAGQDATVSDSNAGAACECLTGWVLARPLCSLASEVSMPGAGCGRCLSRRTRRPLRLRGSPLPRTDRPPRSDLLKSGDLRMCVNHWPVGR